jgi:tetratricopeptide (TPR) repeat protein
LRQRLAMLLYQNGHAEAADQAFPPPADNGPAATWPVLNYANYLGMTQRAEQAETLLAEYLAAHSGLSAAEQANVLVSLASLARSTGDSKRADRYQLESDQKRLPKDPPGDVVRIYPALQKAQSEANTGNTAEAVTLATHAIAQSRNAQNRGSLAQLAPSVANSVSSKAPVQADELYRHAKAMTQSWSADTMEPWLTALAGYPQFLMSQQRSGEALPAIERYRSALKTARGADTGWLEEPLRQTIDVERGRNSLPAAILAAQNLLSLEETLDGPTSEPLYRAVETLADLYRVTGDSDRALPFYQQSIAIADAVFRADDTRRGQSRTNAAAVLIAENRPDDAEPLVLEAIQLRTVTRPAGGDGLTQMLAQIQAMKKTR